MPAVPSISDELRLDIVHLCEQALNTTFGDGCAISIETISEEGQVYHATVVFGNEPCEANTCQLVVDVKASNAELVLAQGETS